MHVYRLAPGLIIPEELDSFRDLANRVFQSLLRRSGKISRRARALIVPAPQQKPGAVETGRGIGSEKVYGSGGEGIRNKGKKKSRPGRASPSDKGRSAVWRIKHVIKCILLYYVESLLRVRRTAAGGGRAKRRADGEGGGGV